jgi:hypothetical protein
MSGRYALISVFDYQGTLSKSGTPKGLLGMSKDIERAFYIANVLCNVPRKNITILTDVISDKDAPLNPWEIKDAEEGDPIVIKMPYPSINIVVESMMKFINKIAFLEHGKKRRIELFSYFSGHGVTFTDPRKEAYGKRTSCIILIDNLGKERRYLSKKELLDIFHSRIKTDELGVAIIPIIQRKLIPRSSSSEYIYSPSSIMVNPGINDVPEGEINIEIFFLYDACQSGSLSGLKYKYIPKNLFKIDYEEEIDIPLSMGVSAANDIQDVPSCADGSPFTLQMREIIRKSTVKRDCLTVKKLNKYIYSTLHPLLTKRCSPTISISVPSLVVGAPVISVLPTKV